MSDNAAFNAFLKKTRNMLNNRYVENDPPVNVQVECSYCQGVTMVAEGGRGECVGCGAPVSPENGK